VILAVKDESERNAQAGGLGVTKESIIEKTYPSKISPNPMPSIEAVRAEPVEA
jgi:hypothetical protein